MIEALRFVGKTEGEIQADDILAKKIYEVAPLSNEPEKINNSGW